MKSQSAAKSTAGSQIEFVAAWRHRTPAHCGFHSHPAWEIIYHPHGTGHGRLEGGTEFEISAGAVEMIPPGVLHAQDMSVIGEDVCVHFAWPSAWGPAPGTLCIPRLTDECVLRELHRLSTAQPGADPRARALCHHRTAAVVLDLLHAAARGENPDDKPTHRYARQARDYVQRNCCTIRRLEEVAQAVGIGSDHLRHVFRRRYGQSLKAWLIEARIGRARDLLSNSALPLKAIAELCGFDNERYFSTHFRRMAGVPPGTFRTASRRAGT